VEAQDAAPRPASAAELHAALRAKRRYDTMTLPVSGLAVRFQSLSALERARHQSVVLKDDGSTNHARLDDCEARLIVACLVDQEGRRLFADREAAAVLEWDSADVAALYRRLCRHCGIDRSYLEGLEKNSVATPSGDSASG